jgi:hypothetical protein
MEAIRGGLTPGDLSGLPGAVVDRRGQLWGVWTRPVKVAGHRRIAVEARSSTAGGTWRSRRTLGYNATPELALSAGEPQWSRSSTPTRVALALPRAGGWRVRDTGVRGRLIADLSLAVGAHGRVALAWSEVRAGKSQVFATTGVADRRLRRAKRLSDPSIDSVNPSVGLLGGQPIVI